MLTPKKSETLFQRDTIFVGEVLLKVAGLHASRAIWRTRTLVKQFSYLPLFLPLRLSLHLLIEKVAALKIHTESAFFPLNWKVQFANFNFCVFFIFETKKSSFNQHTVADLCCLKYTISYYNYRYTL